MEKLNLDQFVSILQQILWQTLSLVSEMFFKKPCTGLITGLMKDLPIESQYINISTYRPLSGRSYIELPDEIKTP